MKQVWAFGSTVPYYIVRFDKNGRSLSPQTVAHLLGAIQDELYSHVLVYSHGWNNDFAAATALFDRFIIGLSDMAAEHPLLARPFRPLFVGIVWPSTALAFGAENGPGIAGAPDEEDSVEALLGSLPEDRRQSAQAMLAQPGVPVDQARELASWLAESLDGDGDGEVAACQPDGDEILAAWFALAGPPAEGRDGFTDFGTAGGSTAAPVEPRAAGWPPVLDPRWIVRLGTVLIMKDRAGTVGANGAADLLGTLLDGTDAKIFLLGHSYGAKVMMTALATLSAAAPRRKVEGVLLLQPAVSRLCFAADLGAGLEGGYVRALDLVARPVLATYSINDFPLTRIFQVVARRPLDAGELQFAGEPSRFAALGGYGASGCAEGTAIDLQLPAAGQWPVRIDPAIRVVSLDGSGSIGGHGDVNRAEIFWAALNLLK